MSKPRQSSLPSLPIDPLIPKIVSALELRPPGARAAVIQASPGSGKTTRIPPALLERPSDGGGAREVVILEPRRVAAKYAARRVAEETGTRLGELVGYQFRFENVSSPATRLRFLTEGMLMRRVLSDPGLRSVHTVILDEFHERHLHGDIALAYLRKLQLTTRPDLRLVVMSATLDTETLSRFLGDAPVLRVDAPVFPVETEYLPSPASKRLEVLVAEAVRAALSPERRKDAGDLLVFLPGMGEIRRCEEALRDLAQRHDALLAPLHGELSREDQDRAIEPSERRKIILATNVAETSLTIPGVRTVIDSGFHRVASYSWWSGVPQLRTRPISRASAIQRAGRAGRTAPGRCIRLYTRGDFDGRAPFQTPEVQRADLAQTVLELKALGIPDPCSEEQLSWFEKPSRQALESAETLLLDLGAATERGGALTDIGKALGRFPAHPRIGRMMLAASDAAEAALLAALIAEGELDSPNAMDALERLRREMPSGRLRKIAEQLRSALPERPIGRAGAKATLARAVLSGFPDRVARRRENGDLVFSAGGSARAPEEAFFRSGEYFVLLDVRERQGLGQARSSTEVASAVAIEPEWLFDLEPSRITEEEELVWDATRKRVQALSRLRYGQLVLSESREEPRGSAGASRILAKEGLGLELESWGTKLTLHDALCSLDQASDDPESAKRGGLESWAARIGLLAGAVSGIAEITPALLRTTVLSVLGGATSLEQAKALSWEAALTACLEQEHPGLSRTLERLVPTEFQLPNGRRARIHYTLGSDPWIESRLQDFFGVRSPPSILGGRHALTLHLLAPNQRAVQVTSDLPGFWSRVYPEIRKELSRRYPRHSWPEDPTRAEPTKR